jgi:hypothetical protein
VLGLGLWILCGAFSGAGDRGGKLLPEADYVKLVNHDAKVIQDALAKGTLDKKTGRKVKATAFMIAVYAQANMKGAGDLAALRDDALKVVKLVEDNNLKEAAAIAARLTPHPKGAGGKAAPVALEKQLDFETVMRQFSSERVGGYGIEKLLEELGESKDALTAEQKERLTLVGYKIAMIGHVADAYADEKNEGGKKTKENWLAFSGQFRQAAVGLAEAARGGTDPAVRTAVEKLSATCTKCHDVFR